MSTSKVANFGEAVCVSFLPQGGHIECKRMQKNETSKEHMSTSDLEKHFWGGGTLQFQACTNSLEGLHLTLRLHFALNITLMIWGLNFHKKHLTSLQQKYSIGFPGEGIPELWYHG